MKLTCPVCEARISLEQAAREELHRELTDLAARFGPNWELAHEYIDCFRQAPHGAIRLKKRVRLLKGLWRLFDRREFELRGRRYRTDWPRILAAVTQIVNAEKYGFINHNYLKKILVQDGQRLSAEGLTAREEEQREVARRGGHVSGPREETGGLQSLREALGTDSLSGHIWGDHTEGDDG